MRTKSLTRNSVLLTTSPLRFLPRITAPSVISGHAVSLLILLCPVSLHLMERLIKKSWRKLNLENSLLPIQFWFHLSSSQRLHHSALDSWPKQETIRRPSLDPSMDYWSNQVNYCQSSIRCCFERSHQLAKLQRQLKVATSHIRIHRFPIAWKVRKGVHR